MAGGIGDLFGGIGSIASSFINAGNQRRANDIAEQNSIMQYMLGNRNVDVQEELGNKNINLQDKLGNKNLDLQDRLGTRNIDLQERFGDRNFNLQKDYADKNFNLQRDTADKTYNLADTQGSRVASLIEAMNNNALRARREGLNTQREGLDLQRDSLKYGKQNLDLQRGIADENDKLAKASRFDAQGNEVYYDPASRSFKIRLAPNEQRLMDANQLENVRRSTDDQYRARRGNEQNEELRSTARSMLTDALNDRKYGKAPVNEGELANQLIVAGRGEQEDALKNVREALTTNAMRTNNTGSIADIGRAIRQTQNSFGTGTADAILKAKQFALTNNNQDRSIKDSRVNLLEALAKFGGDANNAMGNSTGFATTTQQADAGGGRVASANADRGQREGNALLGVGQEANSFGASTKQMGLAESGMADAYTSYGSNVGGAISDRSNRMISALTGGAAGQSGALTGGAGALGGALVNAASAQGNAITNAAAGQGGAITSLASGQGNAINNLMSALSNAYQSEASGIGSSLSQQAKIAANSKFDLSGLGKIGSGLGGLFAALGSTSGDEGGTSTIQRRVF